MLKYDCFNDAVFGQKKVHLNGWVDWNTTMKTGCIETMQTFSFVAFDNPLRALRTLQMQPLHPVWMVNLSRERMASWNKDKWLLICVCVYLWGGLQKNPVCVLHWHSIKSLAPLRIKIHLITCKQQNMNTMNSNPDFPDHWFLQKAAIPRA